MPNLTNTNTQVSSVIMYFLYWSLGFSRQEYWSGLSFPSPGDLPDPGIESRAPALQADFLPSEPPGKPHTCLYILKLRMSYI